MHDTDAAGAPGKDGTGAMGQATAASPRSDVGGADPGASGDVPILVAIERRIAAADHKEALAWLKMREIILRQNEMAKGHNHRRQIDIFEVRTKILLSASAIGSGVLLTFGGFETPSLLCLGAGFYGLAPNFVNAFIARTVDGKGKSR